LATLGAEIVAIDGKTSRRSGGVDATALHLVSAFAAGVGLVLGQRATAEKPNEITAIPELFSTLALAGCNVTINAMGTQTAIAEAIQERRADYVLVVKDNQPKLAESMEDFWRSFRAHPAVCTPHSFAETVEKDHGWLETRRCYVFDRRQCLDKPKQWRGLRCFVVLESERIIGGKTTREQRFYISSLVPDAQRIANAVRSHWSIESRLHWSMDVSFNDDQMRART
jgi:predicted transposase YbfD/YdcC